MLKEQEVKTEFIYWFVVDFDVFTIEFDLVCPMLFWKF